MWLLCMLVVAGVGAMEEKVYTASLDRVLDAELNFSILWRSKKESNLGSFDKLDVVANNVMLMPFSRSFQREGPALVQLRTQPLTYFFSHTIVMKDIYVKVEELKLPEWESSKTNLTIHFISIPLHISEEWIYLNTTHCFTTEKVDIGKLVVQEANSKDDMSESFNSLLPKYIDYSFSPERNSTKYCDPFCSPLFPPLLDFIP